MSYIPERRHPRTEFQQLPWVFSLRLPAPADLEKPVRLEAKNISAGGLKFLANRRFQLFEIIHVTLFEKGSGKALPALQGKIVRIEDIDTGFGERTYGIAVEFVSGGEDLLPLLPPVEKPVETPVEKSSGK